jgi:hypothetical protein
MIIFLFRVVVQFLTISKVLLVLLNAFPPIRLLYCSMLYSSYVNSTVEGSDEAWTDFICNGDASKIFSGDHLESASPADPSFWVIHPTLERLFLAKLI